MSISPGAFPEYPVTALSTPVMNFPYVTLNNGENDNVATGGNAYIIIVGPSAAFSITGFMGGKASATLDVQVLVGQTFTISNLNNGSTAGNQIITPPNTDMTFVGPCLLSFTYIAADPLLGAGMWKLVLSSYASYGGWTINPNFLARDTGVDATSEGLAPADYPFWAGATYANRATAPFRVTPAGALVATSATITGVITATTGAIGGWTIGANTIASASITLNSATPAILLGAATDYNTGIGIFMGLNTGAYKFHVGNPAGNKITWDGSALTLNGDGSGVININGGNIQSATITATQIANATITGAKIAAATIAGSNIGSATITGANIAAGTITGSLIAAGTITGSNIANATIAAANIILATITSAQIASLTIVAGNIQDLTITAGKIANATITGAQIANATITGGLIGAATITGSNIAGGTITGSNIAGATIAGANIVNSTITGGLIANATITGGNIAATTITASNIVAGTITGTQIAAATIAASNIVSNTITTTQLAATAIDGMTITAPIIRTAASPAARVEMNTSFLAGYSDATTKQFYLDASTGKAYAGAGNVTLDANGLTVNTATGYLTTAQWANSADAGAIGTIWALRSGSGSAYDTFYVERRRRDGSIPTKIILSDTTIELTPNNIAGVYDFTSTSAQFYSGASTFVGLILGAQATPSAMLDVRGTALFKNASNSTTAYQFQNAAGTTILDVDTTNGNVGIGTTAPNYANLVIANASVNSGNNSGLAIGRATSLPSSASDYGNIYLFSTDAFAANKGGTISFGGQYGSSGGDTRLAGIFGGKENATDGNYSGFMSFYTRTSGSVPAERIRIDSAGNVGIGTTGSNVVRVQIKGASTTSSDYSLDCLDSNGTSEMYVRNDNYGYLNAVAWNYSSDAKLKTKVMDFPNALDILRQLTPRKYDRINGKKGEHGFIAQEVQSILPSLVSEAGRGKESILALATTELIPFTVRAIQQLDERITKLEQK